MTSPSIPLRLLRLGLGVIVLATAPTFAAEATETAPAAAAPAPSLLNLDYSGSQGAVEALDREIAAAGRDATRLAAIVTHLTRDLRRPSLTFAARQAICLRLGSLLAAGSDPAADADAFAALAKLLTVERDVDLARLALEPVPGAEVDQLFLDAFDKSAGRVRRALVPSLGVRRIAAAVSRLAPLLRDADPVTADSAARALGQIGSAPGLAALRAAPDQTSAAVVVAKLSVAPRLPAVDAKTVLDDVHTNTHIALPLRAAALRGLLALDPAAAPVRIAAALTGEQWTFKEVAIESIASLSAANLVPALSARLASFDEPAQVALIAALGRKGDRAAVPAIVAAAAHASADVRTAALTALGMLPGDASVATLLARIAGTADSADAKLARASLARLNGPEVDAAILAGARRAEPTLRLVFIEQLAPRNMTEGLPLLMECRTDADAAVRAAAVGALGDLAPFSAQQVVLDWASAATDPAEQTRALRALVNITLRNPDAATRAQPVLAAIERAPSEVCLRLVPVLPRLGDPASAECATRLALRTDPAIAAAAVAALGRWTDRAALLPLVTAGTQASLESVRTAAQQAALRYLERNREPWSPELTDIVVRLAAVVPASDTRQQLVALLSRANDPRALALAESLQAEPALAAAAHDAALSIRASIAGPPAFRASGSTGQLRNLMDGKPDTRWSVPANPDQWLEIDFRALRPVRRLTLDQAGRVGDFPEQFEVFVTDNPDEPGVARHSAAGQRTKTVVELPPGTRGRYVLIKHTGERNESSWTVSELVVD